MFKKILTVTTFSAFVLVPLFVAAPAYAVDSENVAYLSSSVSIQATEEADPSVVEETEETLVEEVAPSEEAAEKADESVVVEPGVSEEVNEETPVTTEEPLETDVEITTKGVDEDLVGPINAVEEESTPILVWVTAGAVALLLGILIALLVIRNKAKKEASEEV